MKQEAAVWLDRLPPCRFRSARTARGLGARRLTTSGGTRLALTVALAAALAAPGLARAQESAPPLQENPNAVRYDDVERGYFVGFDAGYLSFLDVMAQDTEAFPAAADGGGRSGGLFLAAELGADLTSRISAALILQGGSQRANPDYGAFSVYAAGVDVRFSYYGRKDRNDWERFFLYVHARGGYAVTFPEGLFGTNDVIVQGGPGLEYFTRLRHFSIGASLDFVRAVKAEANGVTLYSTVRYTF
jgi:hypothetical protein